MLWGPVSQFLGSAVFSHAGTRGQVHLPSRGGRGGGGAGGMGGAGVCAAAHALGPCPPDLTADLGLSLAARGRAPLPGTGTPQAVQSDTEKGFVWVSSGAPMHPH